MRRVPAPALLLALMIGVAAADGAGAGGPLVAAHRGGAALWPENSLAAFRNALALGADLLETDVHLTADGEVVLLHDPTLDRTTSGRGAVGDLTLADVARLRLKAGDGALTDESPPTLAALLDLLAPGRASLLLEIKTAARRRRYPGIEEKTLALVRARGLASRVRVMAFEDATIRRLCELDPAVRTVLLVRRGRVQRARAKAADIVRWVKETGAADLGIDHRALDAEVAAAARAAGLGLSAWTVNEERDIRRVIDLGVDVVITDRPDRVLRLTGR
jgi:glycerophosphoryl diester phosphodiesterase